MNNLSWFLYFADVVGDIGLVSGIIIGVTGLFIISIGFVAFVEDEFDKIKPYRWPALSILLVATLLAVFTPSKTTIYAIAASEMGEEAIQSKTGGKALRALDAWLDRQIEGEPEA